MDQLDWVAPEFRAFLEALPEEALIDLSDIPLARARFAQAMALRPSLISPEVRVEETWVHNPLDGFPVRVKLYLPSRVPPPRPTLLWIHGGGYVLGSPEMNDADCAEWAGELGIVVASVDYRLAPEHPYPIPLEDAYAALRWLAQTAEDRERLAIGGGSAGGGLAAALALLARDRGEVRPAFQLLIYPMLDDRGITPSSQAITDRRLIWTRALNHIGWRAYLGREPGGRDIPPYAAPARAQDLTGLPPAYVMVGTADPFRDEDIAYAQRLMEAGVLTELHVWPGAFHGFEGLVPEAWLSRRARAEVLTVLGKALVRDALDQRP